MEKVNNNEKNVATSQQNKTQEGVKTNERITQTVDFKILHVKGTFGQESYYKLESKISTKEGLSLPVTAGLLADEVALCNLATDGYFSKIRVGEGKSVRLNCMFFQGINENGSTYNSIIVSLPGNVKKLIRFNNRMNSFVSLAIKQQKELGFTVTKLVEQKRSSEFEIIQWNQMGSPEELDVLIDE